MDICSFCLQPGNLFATGESNTFACAKCQPFVQNSESAGDNNAEYNSAIEPQVIVHDGNEASHEDYVLHCNLCNKSFEKNLQYQNHMRNHRAERKYVCPHCTKGFSQSNNLRAHLRIHTNERPYKCQDCGRAFTQVTNLNNHIRLHTGEKPFACKEPGCDKAFAQVTNLNNHRKSHLRDLRMFSCRMCFKTFGQRNHLTQHVTTAHGTGDGAGWVAPPACAACGEAFPNTAELSQHIRTECREQGEFRMRMAKDRGETQVLNPNTKKKSIPSGSIKCLFGDCKLYFPSMQVLHTHLGTKHGLTINANVNKTKLNKSIDYDNEIIEIDDDDPPSKSNSPSQSHQDFKISKNKNNISHKEPEVKQEKESESESGDSSEGEDSDSRESDRRKASASSQNKSKLPKGNQEMKLVCNLCFSTFETLALLESHMSKKH